MKSITWNLLLGMALSLIATTSVQAQKVTNIVEEDQISKNWIFIGFDGGFELLRSGNDSELNKTGYQGDLKARFSHYRSRWVFDAGAGWLYNQLKGDRNGPGLVDDEVRTKAALLELGARHRLGEKKRWELGLLGQSLLGTDTRFSTVGGDEKHVSFLGGLEGAYIFPKRHPIRIHASVLTDINIEDRQLFSFLLGAQIGLGLDPVIEKMYRRPEAPTQVTQPSFRGDEFEKPVVVVTFDLDDIYFQFDKAQVDKDSEAILEAFGEFLSREKDSWGKLLVEGHTDNRGTEEYNQLLSENRSASVKHVLVKSGVAEERIRNAGYGESQPKLKEETEEAWAKNRRVEFIFDKVQDPKKFKQAIDKIREKYGKPKIFPWTRRPSVIPIAKN